ncbi:hypothetical protein BOVAC2_4632 [Bacteroides ovatus]|jgi:hypothetical protein|nr:hypothetical protein BOVAC2_4632 [Bacteroides ovatus]
MMQLLSGILQLFSVGAVYWHVPNSLLMKEIVIL